MKIRYGGGFTGEGYLSDGVSVIDLFGNPWASGSTFSGMRVYLSTPDGLPAIDRLLAAPAPTSREPIDRRGDPTGREDAAMDSAAVMVGCRNNNHISVSPLFKRGIMMGRCVTSLMVLCLWRCR